MAKYKSAKAAVAASLLKGQTLNVKNCFTLFGVTNCAREMPRMIEEPFGVSLIRTQKEGKTRFGLPAIWMDYKLDLDNPANKEGIQRMKEYIKLKSE